MPTVKEKRRPALFRPYLPDKIRRQEQARPATDRFAHGRSMVFRNLQVVQNLPASHFSASVESQSEAAPGAPFLIVDIARLGSIEFLVMKFI